MTKKIQDQQFEEEVLNADKLTIVDFWAPWCAPCKTIAPFLEKVADEYAKRVKVVRLNVQQNKKQAFNYQVRGIPTLMFFQDGAAVKRLVGVHSPDKIKEVIEDLLP